MVASFFGGLAKTVGGVMGARMQVLAAVLLSASLLLMALGLFSIPCVFFSHNVQEYSSCVSESTAGAREFILEAIGE